MSEEKYVISIGFSKPKKFKIFSWLITQFEGTDCSHTFVSWKCTNIDRRKVYEAVGSGSRKISNTVFKKEALVTDIFNFEVTGDDLFKVDQLTHDQAGTPYGWKHALGIGIMRVTDAIYRLIGSDNKARNPFKDGKYSQICVEAGSYVVELAKGIDMPGDIEDYGMREFYKFVSNHGTKVPQEKIDQINGK